MIGRYLLSDLVYIIIVLHYYSIYAFSQLIPKKKKKKYKYLPIFWNFKKAFLFGPHFFRMPPKTIQQNSVLCLRCLPSSITLRFFLIGFKVSFKSFKYHLISTGVLNSFWWTFNQILTHIYLTQPGIGWKPNLTWEYWMISDKVLPSHSSQVLSHSRCCLHGLLVLLQWSGGNYCIQRDKGVGQMINYSEC